MRGDRARRASLLAFFFVSGISGLIYQIAWIRQAALTFGVSAYAYSAVLTAFMLGLALGSYVMGKWADESERPLRVYALVEVGIAVMAALSPFVLTSLDGFYAAVARALEPGLGWLTALRLVMSVAVLTPATFLIGATLPLMSRLYATRGGRVGSDVGRLYLVNTFGAALGCFATGIFLIRLLGLRETVFLGATLNLAVATGALLLAWYSDRRAEPKAAPASPAGGPGPAAETAARREELSGGVGSRAEEEAVPGQERSGRGERDLPEPVRLSRGELRFVAIAYGLSGFVALAYEVIWARILYIHNSHAVYSFSLMLTVFLAGIALGSAAGERWLRRRRVTLAHFGALEIGIGALAIVALLVFARLPSLELGEFFGGYSVGYELSIAAVTLFPPAFLMGVLFPVVGSLYTEERTREVGFRIGSVNALNTLGAIVGSLAAGFALIPLLGLRDTTLALAGLNLAIGCGALWLGARDRPRLRWAAASLLAVPAGAAFVMRPGIYLGAASAASEHLVYYEEGVEATVAVLEMPEKDFKISFVNGRDEVLTDERGMRAFHLLGHLPALLRPEARNALVLSFGNGIATGTLDTHRIPEIEAVDLSRGMIEAAEIFAEENYHVLQSPRVRLHVEDARNFLLRSEEEFDIITTDATHPANASSWMLFTREFYRLVRRHLADDGVFMQWLPRHAVRETDYRAIIRTAMSVFPHITLWATDENHTFIVVTPERLTPSGLRRALETAAENPTVVDDLGPPRAIARYLVMGERVLERYVGEGRVVTDNNAYFMPIGGSW